MGLQALIFDMDGLLFDTERLAAATWAEAACALGFELEDRIVRGAVGLDHLLARDYYEQAFQGRLPYDRIEAQHRELFRAAILQRGVPLKSGVEGILAEAARLGLRVALGTSSRAVYVHAMLWLSGLADHFHVLATRDLVQAGKPAPDIYLKAASLLGLEPRDCLVLEDSPIGVQAARAAEMEVIMVPDLLEPTEAVRCTCLAVVPSLVEAARLLEGRTRQP